MHYRRTRYLIVLLVAGLSVSTGTAATFNLYPYYTVIDQHDANPGDGVARSAEGFMTFRAAIEEANALPGKDEIVLHMQSGTPHYNQVILLNQGPILIEEDLVIRVEAEGFGPSTQLTWGSQNNGIVIRENVILTIFGLEVRCNRLPGPAFTIEENGTLDALTLPEEHLQLTGDSLNVGLHIVRAISTGYGGAILNNGGHFLLSGGYIGLSTSEAGGGGIASLGGTVEIRRSALSGNYSEIAGGGIYVDGGSALFDTMRIYSNDSSLGAGLYIESGDIRIVNTSISENVATDAGGGVYQAGGTLSMVNTTLIQNAVEVATEGESKGEGSMGGGGLFVSEDGSLTMGNTLLTQNIDLYGMSDMAGSLTSLGYNLVSVAEGAVGLDPELDLYGSEAVPFDAGIRTVGPLPLGALEFGSPAIDAGNTALLLNTQYVTEPPMGDVTLYSSRVRLRGASVDIGAFEFKTVLPIHSADQNADMQIDLSEILRVIQFYNSPGLSCADTPDSTEDGFVPVPPGEHFCVPHASDYSLLDWEINLTELLRAIQFFNSDGYTLCPEDDTEDGYCPVTG